MEKTTKSEVHLFIIWENARNRERDIIKDIKNNFNILKVYEITWSKDKFSENLTRFYGTNLPKNSSKEKHCGNGEFLLVLVEDLNPIYIERKTSRGTEVVNSRMFDSKQKYRDWTGGGHKIHGTNSVLESNHDLTLLIGQNTDDFKENNFEKHSKPTAANLDLIGSHGWKSMKELFYVLNNTVNYVVLRNFEGLPSYNLKNHGDIDFLTDNYMNMKWIVNGEKVFKKKYRVHHKVKIGTEEVYYDIRVVGDKYYDKRWQQNILKHRILEKNCFYTPDPETYFYTLLYHAVVHKKQISEDYIERLSSMEVTKNFNNDLIFDDVRAIEGFLNEYLTKNKYEYLEPKDYSVYYNNALINKKNSAMRLLKYNPYRRRIKKVLCSMVGILK